MKMKKLILPIIHRTYILITLVLPCICISSNLYSATYTVTNAEMQGEGSLNQAILEANMEPGLDTIVFDSIVRGSIFTKGSLPTITESLIIFGPGANELAIDAEFEGRCLMTDDFYDDSLLVHGLTFQHGDSKSGGGAGLFLRGGKNYFYQCNITGNSNSPTIIAGGGVYIFGGTTYFYNCEISYNSSYLAGGAICNTSGTRLYIYNSSICNNTVVSTKLDNGGGAIYNAGDIYIENSTFTGNNHPNKGGAIYNILYDRNISLNHVTISKNMANIGGGIFNEDQAGTDTIWLKNSIIAGNSSTESSPDVWGEFISMGKNIIYDTTGAVIIGEIENNLYGIDPSIKDPEKYGENTIHCPLNANSPAIDQAKINQIVSTDQLGYNRSLDGNNDGVALPDIGAVEYFEDTDSDGVSDIQEQGINGDVGNYDGNNDGIADKTQSNVASFAIYSGEHYITIASPEKTRISQVHALPYPLSGLKNSNETSELGYFTFTVDSTQLADALIVSVYLPNNLTAVDYTNYGPPTSGSLPIGYSFSFNGQVGFQSNQNIITLHYKDGYKGDHDLTQNNQLITTGSPIVSSSLSVSYTEAEKVLIYPNPCYSAINIRIPVEEPIDVSLNLTGLNGVGIIRSFNIKPGENHLRISLESFKPGIYLYRLNVGLKIYTGKIVKIKQ